ncbi:MAG: Clp protease N-terminal domain-containing protein, partial [Candidatus Poribacteria bacterium]
AIYVVGHINHLGNAAQTYMKRELVIEVRIMFEKKLAGMRNRAIEPIAIHEEAMRLNHNQIDTEHLLLALIHRGRGVAVRVLLELGVNL